MTTNVLTRELIADASLWRLILRVGSGSVSALLIGPESVERSVLFHQESLADTSVKALENAIYDNPLLLADFGRTDVIFSTSELFAAPEGTAPLHEAMAEVMLPDCSELRRIEADSFDGGDVVYAVGADVFNFVARTFASARFHNSLAIDTTYLAHRNRAASGAAHFFALCEGEGELALIGFDSVGRLSFISRPQAPTAADCAYRILAAGATRCPVSVGGVPALRNEVCDILRRMEPAATVLPMTLPEDLLHLRRMAPEATFDMIFLTQL